MRKIIVKFSAVLITAVLLFSARIPIAKASSVLTIIVDDAIYCYSYPEIDSYMGELYLKNLDEVLKGICQNENVEAVNATAEFYPNAKERFKYTKELCGKKVSFNLLKQGVLDALSVGGGTLTIKSEKLLPTITKAELINKTKLRSSFTTYYQYVENRVNNIKLATRHISGTKLEVGESFSFNKTVGTRNESRGFKAAPIIVRGEFVEGVGGGVCQVSTTLYNAALLANLKIIEQHAHSLAVGYIARSFDAMVNSYSADLKFTNTTNSPIYIEGRAEGNYVYFKIYGEESESEFVRESTTLKVIEPKSKTVETNELMKGESQQLVFPRCGYESEGYIVEYKNGKIINKQKIRSDKYNAVDEVVLIGNKNEE